jgi:hypothetical protein
MSKPIRQRMIQPARDRAYATAHMCKATAAVTADQIVAVTGSTKALKEVQPADANGGALLRGAVLLIADYAVGLNETARGFVEWKMLQDVNTAAAAVGDAVFLSDTAGGWALTPGTNPIQIGMVTTSHATAGAVLLDPKRFSGSSDGLPQLYVTRITSAELTAVDTTQIINFPVSLGSGDVVLGAWINLVALFTGPSGIGNTSLKIGNETAADVFFVSAANEVGPGATLGISTSASIPAGSKAWAGGWVPQAASALRVQFDCASSTLSQTNVGDVFVYVLILKANTAITV